MTMGMTMGVYVLAGAAAAAVGMWYWKRQEAFSFSLSDKKSMAVGGTALLLSLAFAAYLGFQGWDLFLNLKFLILYDVLLSASIVDWKKRIISNRLVAGAFGIRLLVFALEYLFRRETFLQNGAASFWGLVFGFGFLFLISILTKRSIGFGDVKLFAAVGIYSGFLGTFYVLFYALCYCAIVSLVLLIRKKADKKSRIPFAPFIYFGFITMILFRAF